MNSPSSETPAAASSSAADGATAGGHGHTLAERLAFLELTADDAAALRGLAPEFERYADAFVEEFYHHLFRFDATSRFLNDPQLVERLKQSQREHFRSMLAAQWDEEYLARRRSVGDAHADVGIEPEIFLGAYNQYVQRCFPRFAAAQGDDVQRSFTWLLPLLKAILLDIGLTLEAYFLQATQRLRHALDMVWKANTELRQFAQFTSHDLKTPLATVANLCDEALDEFGGQMPAEARKLIEAARTRAFRMSATIDELLETTIATPTGEDLAPVPSREFIDEAIERVRPLLDTKRIEIVVAGDLPTIWGNKVRLREAFYNLISNAAKFIDKTPGRIEIGAESTFDRCVFHVTDNGPGIPSEERERIFVPFRRLPMHRDRAGSGLGLYFTKMIVEQQGGRIWVESNPTGGSRFFIALNRKNHASQ